MNLTQFPAVIFDMDGVLVDNHHAHYKAWLAFSHKYSFPLNEESYLKDFNGKTNRDLFYILFGDISEEKIAELINEKEEMYQKIYYHEMAPHTGLIQFLEKLRKNKFKIAVGTSAPPMNVDFVLDRLNLRQYFDVVVDGSMVTKGKPDPEIYLKCKSLLGVTEAIVFEDAMLGIQAAKSADCFVIGVATTHCRDDLKGVVSVIVDDFEESEKLFSFSSKR